MLSSADIAAFTARLADDALRYTPVFQGTSQSNQQAYHCDLNRTAPCASYEVRIAVDANKDKILRSR